MSYDLRVWTTKEYKEYPEIPAQTEGKNWLLQVGPSSKVEDDDIPEEVAGSLPGIQYVIDLHLEPIGAPKTAHTLLQKTAKLLAKKYHGVIEDPQIGSVTLPSGVKRYIGLPKQKGDRKPLASFRMHWMLSDDSPLVKDGGIDALMEYLQKNLPEALPRRYDFYEPPKFKIEETGLTHFLNFFKEHLGEVIVWYPYKPVRYVDIEINKEYGFKQSGDSKKFSCHSLAIGIDYGVFNQPGWETHLKKVWRDISLMACPFFGVASTGYTWLDPDTGIKLCEPSEVESMPHHPIGSWWWTGIPKKLGQAIVVGNPYLNLWSEIHQFGQKEDGLLFVSTENWNEEKDITEMIGDVPNRLAEQEEGYPQVFPFIK